ncbi:MAG: hypothetical protein WDM79_14940 [Terricaulis sp.]
MSVQDHICTIPIGQDALSDTCGWLAPPCATSLSLRHRELEAIPNRLVDIELALIRCKEASLDGAATFVWRSMRTAIRLTIIAHRRRKGDGRIIRTFELAPPSEIACDEVRKLFGAVRLGSVGRQFIHEATIVRDDVAELVRAHRDHRGVSMFRAIQKPT